MVGNCQGLGRGGKVPLTLGIKGTSNVLGKILLHTYTYKGRYVNVQKLSIFGAKKILYFLLILCYFFNPMFVQAPRIKVLF